MHENKILDYKSMANALRFLSIDAIQEANSGHPGMPMGMADVFTILFGEFICLYPKDPTWINRDRFVLSAGHGSILLYSVMHLMGYEEPSLTDIKNFRQLYSKAAGHPEYKLLPGVDATTGPLGQGLANAVGMAIAERIINTKFDFISNRTYAVVGDGCLMEGISHEAASLAGHLRLNKLIVFFDDNRISIDGPTSLTNSDNHEQRFLSYGWLVIKVDGHDYSAIRDAIYKAQQSDRPTIIMCRTIIAYGSPNKANSEKSHGSPLGVEEVANTRKNLNWQYGPFEIPSNIRAMWLSVGERSADKYNKWQNIFDFNPLKKECLDFFEKESLSSQKIDSLLLNLKKVFLQKKPSQSTRQSSGEVLRYLNDIVNNFIGGSADLSISNCTIVPSSRMITKDSFDGNYIHYGIREHAMAAIMNGLSLYGGFVPYGGTFLVFSDYCRPSIRLSAMMGLQVIYIMTHDSIGVGEDGPTHQPIEHLASLRAIPNLFVFRPADVNETIDCWRMALKLRHSPSVFVLSRQNVDFISPDFINNAVSKGIYLVHETKESDVTKNKTDVNIFSSGSDVSLAAKVVKALEKEYSISCKLFSCPCLELFDYSEQPYRKNILNSNVLNVVIESACSFGWEKYVGQDALFFCINTFGISAPAHKIYNHFNLTPEQISSKIYRRIKNAEQL